MRTDDFDYELPPELIAQEPAARRDQSRLLVVERARGTIDHHLFSALPELLSPADLLVLNNTRVLPARLFGRRESTGGRWEGLFLHQTADGLWELMSQTRGRLREDEIISIEPGPLRLSMIARTPERNWLARPLVGDESKPSTIELLERHGHVPLPPYIRKGSARAADRERYQTVFAERPGAVAAPTAGLHFTPEVLAALAARGIGHCFITLHVGVGTFRPIQADNIEEHRMHQEWGELSQAAAEAIAARKARGGRVVAVGTTSVRVLETVAATGPIRPWSGETDLYIYPPYPFRAVDAMITNFHLPRSTLLLMVSAFAGIELIRRAYRAAVEERYRFYSYGDAMLIV
jgi:S-adenosylmethionine:tRNA ribosyltransferase-isomerase